MPDTCSIIVPTHNRVTALKKCIQSLLTQKEVDCEIIVVNDGSSDATQEYLMSLQDNRIKVIHHPHSKGPSNARNAGIKQAQHELLLFIDDDCVAEKKWAAELCKKFHPKTAFVIGETIYREKGYVGYFPERLVSNHRAVWPMGCNIAFRKSVLENIGGFDTAYDQYHNEDTELAIRATSKGATYNRALDAVVYHQEQLWNVDSLLSSARNASVWPRLKRVYPVHYSIFVPPVTGGIVVNVEDYLYILFFKLLVIILFVRYLYHGKRDVVIFFAKWPVWLILRRLYIYKEAWENKIFMV